MGLLHADTLVISPQILVDQRQFCDQAGEHAAHGGSLGLFANPLRARLLDADFDLVEPALFRRRDGNSLLEFGDLALHPPLRTRRRRLGRHECFELPQKLEPSRSLAMGVNRQDRRLEIVDKGRTARLGCFDEFRARIALCLIGRRIGRSIVRFTRGPYARELLAHIRCRCRHRQ